MGQCQLQQNEACSGGGLLVQTFGIINVNKTTFYGNTAQNGGGSWVQLNGYAQFTNSSFELNAASLGGGIGCYSVATINLKDCVISFNQATRGGGVYSVLSNVHLDSSNVDLNTALQQGGGMFVDIQDYFKVYATNSSFVLNKAPKDSSIFVTSQILFSTYLFSTKIAAENITMPTNFCCSGLSKSNPSYEICNFPACNETCLTVNGCDCPYNFTSESESIPEIFPCECSDGFMGSICNEQIVKKIVCASVVKDLDRFVTEIYAHGATALLMERAYHPIQLMNVDAIADFLAQDTIAQM
eukprot:Phypoly_transcript_02002.p1 GENE.Phypoly_transcript_02002~~Phypoly_transcript_02002.p1  ORF type:complete len:299 (+),score=27.36 Phypoly_transcript_02002:1049-1945(+)